MLCYAISCSPPARAQPAAQEIDHVELPIAAGEAPRLDLDIWYALLLRDAALVLVYAPMDASLYGYASLFMGATYWCSMVPVCKVYRRPPAMQGDLFCGLFIRSIRKVLHSIA
jgi:hypothetical protein